jgi:hypothetical protein
MHTLPHRILPALVFTLTLFALLPESRAGNNIGDDTNAAAIPWSDGPTWGQYMHQVMGGTSTTLPGAPRGPAGVYAVVRLTDRIQDAMAKAKVLGKLKPCDPVPQAVDDALTTYFSYILGPSSVNNPISGLLILAQWQDLSPCDPGTDLESLNSDSVRFTFLNDALKAIDAWNKANSSLLPKTLQLVVTPGFNSPEWLFEELHSCDGLFMAPNTPPATTLSTCDYTTIFYRVESAPRVQLPLPLPWSKTYKEKWRFFLTALNKYIGSRQEFVSIAVAGPTASSAEIILPNGNRGTIKSPNPNADGNLFLRSDAYPHGPAVPEMTVYTAWNCLLGNNYGVKGDCIHDKSYGTGPAGSDYINTERAFIEEWASAIDMYGQIFSGVTLVVTTGKGLPEFSNTNSGFLMPPPALTPDCAPVGMTATMDCSAETAIVAYLAGPPIGGANAKATEEDGLVAQGGNILNADSVKWLSEQTSTGFSVLPNSPALVSHVLGGLQFAGATYEKGSMPEGPLFNILRNFFAGTAGASQFGVGNMGTNNGVPFLNAPINYLQVWEKDFIYAYGWQNCIGNDGSMVKLMTSPPGCTVVTKMPTVNTHVPFLGMAGFATALDLLTAANDTILNLTAEQVALPTCGCSEGFFPRGAFLGDPVCVTQMQRNQVKMDNTAAQSGSSYVSGYNYTVAPPLPPYTAPIPYGVCKTPGPLSSFGTIFGFPLVYRQAYMGDYVCVTGSPIPDNEAQQVANDNASYPSNVQSCALRP